MCEFQVCDVQGQHQGRNEHQEFLTYGRSGAQQLLCSESALTLRYYRHPLALVTFFQGYLLISSVGGGTRGVCSGAQFDPVTCLAVYSMSSTLLGVPL